VTEKDKTANRWWETCECVQFNGSQYHAPFQPNPELFLALCWICRRACMMQHLSFKPVSMIYMHTIQKLTHLTNIGAFAVSSLSSGNFKKVASFLVDRWVKSTSYGIARVDWALLGSMDNNTYAPSSIPFDFAVLLKLPYDDMRRLLLPQKKYVNSPKDPLRIRLPRTWEVGKSPNELETYNK